MMTVSIEFNRNVFIAVNFYLDQYWSFMMFQSADSNNGVKSSCEEGQ